MDRLATNLPMFEGEKKGGKKERQRERERFEFRSLLLPRVLLRPGRDIGERCQ